jgi:ABC-type transport system involved in multi-copper enzyme maturation permease subunit
VLRFRGIFFSSEARLLLGPVFSREWVTAPRRLRFYIGKAAYVAALLALMSTAWLLLTGTQDIRGVGDMARFGATLFQLLAPLQMALVLFFSALLAASAVAQEKDRRTLVLLLMTRLSGRELVLGRLFSSLLQVFVLLAAAWPMFLLAGLFGGISGSQIVRVFAVTLAAALAAGSIGSTLALWREKTFQTLALAFLTLMFWLALAEVLVAVGNWGFRWQGVSTAVWGAGVSPWRAVLAAARPLVGQAGSLPLFGSPVLLFLAVAGGITVLANAVAIGWIRVWNPSRELQTAPGANEDLFQRSAANRETKSGPATAAKLSPHAARQRTRPVWNNPILWREIRTRAYGRKILAIRLAYLLLFALAAVGVHSVVSGGGVVGGGASGATALRDSLVLHLAPLVVLSLILVNALAVTSITTERDLGALDLLLVTDLAPAEFIFGKLGGIFYVAKEMIVLPLLLLVYLYFARAASAQNLVYLLFALLLNYTFVATLGIHAGLTYANSRHAVAVSLGTVFFLLVGIGICMRIMMSFSGSFELQLTPFLVFMVGGGICMFVALGVRNPSAAIGWASFACPLFTFVAITSYLQEQTLGPFLIICATYGFTTAAMMIPAIYEFDVATGRTSGPEE